jgi:ArsR family transcriptional regulator
MVTHRAARNLIRLPIHPCFYNYENMKTADAIAALAALAQEHRLAAFRALVRRGPGGLAAGELAARLEVPPATLSFHLKELSAAGLVTSTRDGRSIIYAANFRRMNTLMDFLGEHCCAEEPGAGCTPKASVCCAPSQGEKK